MSKVLITYLSKLTSKNTISYSTEDSGVIEAYYTNEAGVKYFAEREDTKDIDTIIAVCSPEVMKKSDIDVSISAFEDFSDSITLGKIENLDGRFSDLAEKNKRLREAPRQKPGRENPRRDASDNQ